MFGVESPARVLARGRGNTYENTDSGERGRESKFERGVRSESRRQRKYKVERESGGGLRHII